MEEDNLNQPQDPNKNTQNIFGQNLVQPTEYISFPKYNFLENFNERMKLQDEFDAKKNQALETLNKGFDEFKQNTQIKDSVAKINRPLGFGEVSLPQREKILGIISKLESTVQPFGKDSYDKFLNDNPWMTKWKDALNGKSWEEIQKQQQMGQFAPVGSSNIQVPIFPGKPQQGLGQNILNEIQTGKRSLDSLTQQEVDTIAPIPTQQRADLDKAIKNIRNIKGVELQIDAAVKALTFMTPGSEYYIAEGVKNLYSNGRNFSDNPEGFTKAFALSFGINTSSLVFADATTAATSAFLLAKGVKDWRLFVASLGIFVVSNKISTDLIYKGLSHININDENVLNKVTSLAQQNEEAWNLGGIASMMVAFRPSLQPDRMAKSAALIGTLNAANQLVGKVTNDTKFNLDELLTSTLVGSIFNQPRFNQNLWNVQSNQFIIKEKLGQIEKILNAPKVIDANGNVVPPDVSGLVREIKNLDPFFPTRMQTARDILSKIGKGRSVLSVDAMPESQRAELTPSLSRINQYIKDNGLVEPGKDWLNEQRILELFSGKMQGVPTQIQDDIRNLQQLLSKLQTVDPAGIRDFNARWYAFASPGFNAKTSIQRPSWLTYTPGINEQPISWPFVPSTTSYIPTKSQPLSQPFMILGDSFPVPTSIFNKNLPPEKLNKILQENDQKQKTGEIYKDRLTPAGLAFNNFLKTPNYSKPVKDIIIKKIVDGNILLLNNLNDMPSSGFSNDENYTGDTITNSLGFYNRRSNQEIILADNIWNSAVESAKQMGEPNNYQLIKGIFTKSLEETLVAHETWHGGIGQYGKVGLDRAMVSLNKKLASGNYVPTIKPTDEILFDSAANGAINAIELVHGIGSDEYLDASQAYKNMTNSLKQIEEKIRDYGDGKYKNISNLKMMDDLHSPIQEYEEESAKLFDIVFSSDIHDSYINWFYEGYLNNRPTEFLSKLAEGQYNPDIRDLLKTAVTLYEASFENPGIYDNNPLQYLDEVMAYTVESNPQLIGSEIDSILADAQSFAQNIKGLKDRASIVKAILNTKIRNSKYLGRNFVESSKIRQTLANYHLQSLYPGTNNVTTISSGRRIAALNLMGVKNPYAIDPFVGNEYIPTKNIILKDIANNPNKEILKTTRNYLEEDVQSNAENEKNIASKKLNTNSVADLLMKSQPSDEAEVASINLEELNDNIIQAQKDFQEEFPTFVEKKMIVPGNWLIDAKTKEISRFVGFKESNDEENPFVAVILAKSQKYKSDLDGYIIFNQKVEKSLDEFDKFVPLDPSEIQFMITASIQKEIDGLTNAGEKSYVDTIKLNLDEVQAIINSQTEMDASGQMTPWLQKALNGIRFTMSTAQNKFLANPIWINSVQDYYVTSYVNETATKFRELKWQQHKMGETRELTNDLQDILNQLQPANLKEAAVNSYIQSYSREKLDSLRKYITSDDLKLKEHFIENAKVRSIGLLKDEILDAWLLQNGFTAEEVNKYKDYEANLKLEDSDWWEEIPKDYAFKKMKEGYEGLEQEIDKSKDTFKKKTGYSEDELDKISLKKATKRLLPEDWKPERGRLERDLERSSKDLVKQIALYKMLAEHYAIPAATWSGEYGEWKNNEISFIAQRLNSSYERSEEDLRKLLAKPMPAGWEVTEYVKNDFLMNSLSPNLIQQKKELELNKGKLLDEFNKLNDEISNFVKSGDNESYTPEQIESFNRKEIVVKQLQIIMPQIEQIDNFIKQTHDSDAFSKEVIKTKKSVRSSNMPEKISALGWAITELYDKAGGKKITIENKIKEMEGPTGPQPLEVKNQTDKLYEEILSIKPFQLVVPNIYKLMEEQAKLDKEISNTVDNLEMAISQFKFNPNTVTESLKDGYSKNLRDLKVKKSSVDKDYAKEISIRNEYLDELDEKGLQFDKEKYNEWRIQNALSRYISSIAKVGYLKLVTNKETDMFNKVSVFAQTSELGDMGNGNFEKDLFWQVLSMKDKQKPINILFSRFDKFQIVDLAMIPIETRIQQNEKFRKDMENPSAFTPYYSEDSKTGKARPFLFYSTDASLVAFYRAIKDYVNPQVPKSLLVDVKQTTVNAETGVEIETTESVIKDLTDDEFRKIVKLGSRRRMTDGWKVEIKLPDGRWTTGRVKNRFSAKSLIKNETKKHGKVIISKIFSASSQKEINQKIEKKLTQIEELKEAAKTKFNVGVEIVTKSGKRIIDKDTTKLETKIKQLQREISELEDEKEIAWDFGWSNSEKEIFKGILAEKYNELGINYDTKLISRDIEDSIDLLREQLNEGINAMAGFYEGQLDSNGNLITNKKGLPILRKELSKESKNKYDIKTTNEYMGEELETLWSAEYTPFKQAISTESKVDPQFRANSIRSFLAKSVAAVGLSGTALYTYVNPNRVLSGETFGQGLGQNLPIIGAVLGAYAFLRGNPKQLRAYLSALYLQSKNPKYSKDMLGRTRFILRTITDSRFGFDESTRYELSRFQEQWSSLARQLEQTTNELHLKLEPYCYINDDPSASFDFEKSLKYVSSLTTYFDPVDNLLKSNPETGPNKNILLLPIADEVYRHPEFVKGLEVLKLYIATAYKKLVESNQVDFETDMQKQKLEKMFKLFFGNDDAEKNLAIINMTNDLINLVSDPSYITTFPRKAKFAGMSLPKPANLHEIALKIRKEILVKKQTDAFNELPEDVRPLAAHVKFTLEEISRIILQFEELLKTRKPGKEDSVKTPTIAEQIDAKIGEYLPTVYEAFESHESWLAQPNFNQKKLAFLTSLTADMRERTVTNIQKVFDSQNAGKIWSQNKVKQNIEKFSEKENKQRIKAYLNSLSDEGRVEVQEMVDGLIKGLHFYEKEIIDKKTEQPKHKLVDAKKLFEKRKKALKQYVYFALSKISENAQNQFVKLTNEIESNDYISFKTENAPHNYVPNVLRKAIFERLNLRLLNAYQNYLGMFGNPLERATVGSVKNIQFLASASFQKRLRQYLIDQGFASTSAFDTKTQKPNQFTETFTNTDEARSEAIARAKKSFPYLNNLYFTPFGKILVYSWLEQTQDNETLLRLYKNGIAFSKITSVIFNSATWMRQVVSDGVAGLAYGGNQIIKSNLWSVTLSLQKSYRYGKPVSYDKEFVEQVRSLFNEDAIKKFDSVERLINQIMGGGIFEENILAKDVLSNLGTNQPIFSILTFGDRKFKLTEFINNVLKGKYSQDAFNKVLKQGRYATTDSIKSVVSTMGYFFGTTNNAGRLNTYIQWVNSLSSIKSLTDEEVTKLAYGLTHRTVPRFQNYPEMFKLASRYGIFNPYIFFEIMGTRSLINQIKTISMLANSDGFEEWLGRKPTLEEKKQLKQLAPRLLEYLLIGVGLNALFLFSIFYKDDEEESSLTASNRDAIQNMVHGFYAGKPYKITFDKDKNQVVLTHNEYSSQFSPQINFVSTMSKAIGELYDEVQQPGVFNYEQSMASGGLKRIEDWFRSKSSEALISPVVTVGATIATGRDPKTGDYIDEDGNRSTLIERVPETISTVANQLSLPDINRLNKIQKGEATLTDWLELATIGKATVRIPVNRFFNNIFYDDAQLQKNVMSDFASKVKELKEGESVQYHLDNLQSKYIVTRNTIVYNFDLWKKSGLQTSDGWTNLLTGNEGRNTPLVVDKFTQVAALYGHPYIKEAIDGIPQEDIRTFAQKMYIEQIPPSKVVDSLVSSTSNTFMDIFKKGMIPTRTTAYGQQIEVSTWSNFSLKQKENMMHHFNSALAYLYAAQKVNEQIDIDSVYGNTEVVSGNVKFVDKPDARSLGELKQDLVSRMLSFRSTKLLNHSLLESEELLQSVFANEHAVQKYIDEGRQLNAKLSLDSKGNIVFTGNANDKFAVEKVFQFVLLETFRKEPSDKTRLLMGFQSFSSMENADMGWFDRQKHFKKNNYIVNHYIDNETGRPMKITTEKLMENILLSNILRVQSQEIIRGRQ